MPWVLRQGAELWCFGVLCLLVSSASVPGAVTVRAAADLFGVGGIVLVTLGVLRLPTDEPASAGSIDQPFDGA